MNLIVFQNKTFHLDEDGFLENFEEWCPEWVEYVKSNEKLEDLTDEHWKLIRILQEYYKKYGIAPMVRMLSRTTGFKMKRIFELFPSGPGKGACKIAGLPKPKGCV
jgi:dissimilatory sulfite reductase related protein